MDLEKENGALLFQRGMSSDVTSRVQGLKSFHQSVKKDTGVIKRKPLGLVNTQSANDLSKKDSKGKQKVDFKKSTERPRPSLLPKSSSAIATQPCSSLHNAINQSADANPAEIQYDEIEFMDRPKDLEDDFCDLCPNVDQPATYVSDLLNWYPCMWSGGKHSLSPVSERSLSPIASPDWKSSDFWLDETVVEPQLPHLPSLPDDLDDEL